MNWSFTNVLKIGVAFSLGMYLGQAIANLLGFALSLLLKGLLG